MGHCEVRGCSQWEDVDVKSFPWRMAEFAGNAEKCFSVICPLPFAQSCTGCIVKSISLQHQKSRLNRRDETFAGRSLKFFYRRREVSESLDIK